MTSANARTAANVILASAGVAAAYVILTTPSLRRIAANGLRLWLGGASVSGYLFNEARQAWSASGRAGSAGLT